MKLTACVSLALAGLIGLAGVAEASSARCVPVANRNGDGTTTITAYLCLCLDYADLYALMQNPGGNLTIEFEHPVDLTENDFWDDDELGIAFDAGSYSVPKSAFYANGPCPPYTNEKCAPIPGTDHTVSDESYGSEDPADFEYYEEGVPEPRPTVTIPGGSTIPISFPSNQS